MRDLVKIAVNEFNKTLGISDFELPEHGVIEFSFVGGDQFYIKKNNDGDGVLFYLVREVISHHIDTLAKRSLVLCHYENSRKFDTQCALKDSNQLIFAISIPVSEINGLEIDKALQYLMKLHDTLSP